MIAGCEQDTVRGAAVWVAYLAALSLVPGTLYPGGRAHLGPSAPQMVRLIVVLLLVSGMPLPIKAWNT